MKKRYLFLPYKFKITPYPIWVSPLRRAYYTKTRKNSDNIALKNAGLVIPFTAKENGDNNYIRYAYIKGWIKIEMFQAYGYSDIRKAATNKRRLDITLYEPAVQYNNILQKSIQDILNFYQSVYGKLIYRIIIVRITDEGFKTKPLISFLNPIFMNIYFYNLQQREPIT